MGLVKIERAKEKHRQLAGAVCHMISQEGKNMLKRKEGDIAAKIVSQEAILAINSKKPVGYVELGIWSTDARVKDNLLVEIEGLVVVLGYRHRGIATDLVKEAICLAQKRFPGRRVIALANENSFPIFIKAGMEEIEKHHLPEALWSVCSACGDYGNFPSCHCRGLILKNPKKNGGLNFTMKRLDCIDLEELAKLYCEIWKEPPWNETFWQPEQVVIDIEQELKHKNACGFAVFVSEIAYWGISHGRDDQYIKSKIVCFTFGYEVTADELFQISGHREMNYLFESGRVFYLADLATKKDYRQKGLAKKISLKLLKFAEEKKISHVVLRTEIQATAARNLYRRLGFKELNIFDAKYKTRSYWVLNLTH